MGNAPGHRSHTHKTLLVVIAFICLLGLILLSVRACLPI